MYDLYRIIIYIQQINRLGFESRLVQLMFTKQKKMSSQWFFWLVQSIWFEYLFLKLVCFLSWISLNIAIMLRCSQTNCRWFSCGDKASFINLVHFFFDSLDGPDPVTIKQEPSAAFLKKGSNLTLSCSAKSSPAAEFVWLFNGAALPEKTATVFFPTLTEDQSGNYSCMAHNSKTLRYVTSEVAKLSVLGESFKVHMK